MHDHMTPWAKPMASMNNANCAECRRGPRGADIRDTKNRGDGFLSFPRAEWAALVATARPAAG